MHWLPFVSSALAAAAGTAPLLRLLERAGVTRENYRGAVLPAASGVVIAVAALVALGPLALIQELGGTEVFRPELPRLLVYVLGVAVLGLVDDLLGGRVPAGVASRPEAPRGWRGHGRAVMEGRVSTGALKAVGSLGLALYVMAGRGLPVAEYLLAVALLVLTTNLFNLLDLRPGRAGKAFVVLGAGVTVGSWDVEALQTVALLAGPILVLLPFDLRERAMLGDVGSNVVGAVAGFWLVLSLSAAGQAAALAVVAAITVYGEFRSISATIEKNPLLRRLDCLGRQWPTDATTPATSSSQAESSRPSGRASRQPPSAASS